MEIEDIKRFLEEELSKGNKEPYKKIRSFCNKLYRYENKERVSLYNSKYYGKIKKHTEHNKKSKRHTEIIAKNGENKPKIENIF